MTDRTLFPDDRPVVQPHSRTNTSTQDATDKRQAAIHEAGHLTVAVALGWRGSAYLWPSGTSNPNEIRLWCGQFCSLFRTISAEIAVAGLVAELLDEVVGVCLDDEAWAIVELIEDGTVEPSATDRSLMPESLDEQEAAVLTALQLLRNHKEFFDWAVAELVDYDAITDGMAWDKFYSALEDDFGAECDQLTADDVRQMATQDSSLAMPCRLAKSDRASPITSSPTLRPFLLRHLAARSPPAPTAPMETDAPRNEASARGSSLSTHHVPTKETMT